MIFENVSCSIELLNEHSTRVINAWLRVLATVLAVETYDGNVTVANYKNNATSMDGTSGAVCYYFSI